MKEKRILLDEKRRTTDLLNKKKEMTTVNSALSCAFRPDRMLVV